MAETTEEEERNSPCILSKLDPKIAEWIIEFLLRQPLPDFTTSLAVSALVPVLSSNPSSSIRIPVILRRLIADIVKSSFTESTLDALDYLIDSHLFDSPNETFFLQDAYCTAAVAATLESLGDSERFFEGFQVIWRKRIAMLEEEVSGFVPDWYTKIVERMEKFVGMEIRGETVVDMKAEAVRLAAKSMKELVKRAWELVGKSFLERMASMEWPEGVEVGGFVAAAGDRDEARVLEEEDGIDHDATEDDEIGGDFGQRDEIGGDFAQGNEIAVGSEEGGGIGGESDGTGGEGQGQIEMDSRTKDVTREVVDKKGKGVMSDDLAKKIAEINSSVVCKAQASLRESCLKLHSVVEDPLPAALDTSRTIKVAIEAKDDNKQEGNEDLVEHDIDASAVNKDKGKTCEKTEYQHRESASNRRKKISVIDRRPGVGLLERNKTARTEEWVDYPGDYSGVQANNANNDKPQRRKRKFWSTVEEDALRDAVKRHGAGNWKFILDAYSSVFHGRTDVDLKDKWRNMTRH